MPRFGRFQSSSDSHWVELWTNSHQEIQRIVFPDGAASHLEIQENKGVANGYAPLDSSALVPTVNFGTGVADATTFLRGDRTWAVAGGGGPPAAHAASHVTGTDQIATFVYPVGAGVGTHGFVPAPTNPTDVTKALLGGGGWGDPGYATTAGDADTLDSHHAAYFAVAGAAPTAHAASHVTGADQIAIFVYPVGAGVGTHGFVPAPTNPTDLTKALLGGGGWGDPGYATAAGDSDTVDGQHAADFDVAGAADAKLAKVSGTDHHIVHIVGTGALQEVEDSGIASDDLVTMSAVGGASNLLFTPAADRAAAKTSQLFWDETNSRLGLVNAAPDQRLNVSFGAVKFDYIPAPTAPSAALAGAGAGNVNNGAHKYYVTYYAAGTYETNLSPVSNIVTVVNNTTNGKVTVTIPVSTNPFVIYRRIYRTKAGGSAVFFLANVTNNTAVTYTDNTADASLTGTDFLNRQNNTAGTIWQGAYRSVGFAGSNTGLGLNVFPVLTEGSNNTAIGSSIGIAAVYASYNACFGSGSGQGLTSGQHNLFIGTYAGYKVTSGGYNVCFGSFAGSSVLTTSYTVAVGMNAGRAATAARNLFFGANAGYTGTSGAWATTTGTLNTFIGSGSGQASATQRNRSIAIGNNAMVDADNVCALGGVGADAVKVGIGLTTPTAQLHVMSSIADGASAVAAQIDTTTAWSNAGAKLLSVQNNSIEKFSINKDGVSNAVGGYAVGASVGISETLTFHAVNPGDVVTLTVVGGLITARTVLP